ncbi:hypothetical protein ABKV33_13285 [Enterobacter ludwigii]|uniref:hypothetical protein n=1 Tax=Enterobacter ludwigii TaxID=299767 RepID=UPI002FD639C9
MSHYNNYDVLANEVKIQAKKENIINWDDLSWGRGVSFKNNNHIKKDKNMGAHFQQLSKVIIYRECFPNLSKSLLYLAVMKIMESSFFTLNVEPHIVNINSEVINNILFQVEKKYSNSRAGAIEKALKNILEVLAINNIIDPKLSKFNSRVRIIRNKAVRDLIGQKEIKNKLPEEEVIDLVGRVFSSNDKSQRDIFTTSIIALLLCAPTRISEVLSLEVDCEVEGNDIEGKGSYGIRYHSAKGYGESIKWIPRNMQSIAKLAIKRLRVLSRTARYIATLREKGELEFYKSLETDENGRYFHTKLYKLLNLNCMDCFNVKTKNILMRVESGILSAKEFWNEVFNYSDKTKSWDEFSKSINLSNRLLILNKDQLHLKKGVDLFCVLPANKKMFIADFKKRSEKETTLNFFQRHKTLQPNGMKEIFSSHQPRHLLNTLAQRAMLSDIEIAFWSGRKNVEQNNVYDNRTWEELRQNERRVLFADEMISDLGGGSKDDIICKIKDHLQTLEEKNNLYRSQYNSQKANYVEREIQEVSKIINHIVSYYLRGELNE